MLQRLIPALLSLGLLASPALAQTSGQNSQNTNRSMSGNTSGNNAASQDPAQIQQHIQQDLTKAGYTDVHVMPGSFLVQAKDSQGNRTQMMITPGGITEVTAQSQGNGNGGSQGNSGSSGSNNRQ